MKNPILSIKTKYTRLSTYEKRRLIVVAIVSLIVISPFITYQSYASREKEPIYYSTQTVSDDTKLIGEQEVVTTGQTGVREGTYSIQKRDGIIVTKKLTHSKTIKQAVTRVIKKGTVVSSQVPETEAIAFDKTTQPSDALYKNQTQVTQTGVNGVRIKTYEVRTLRGQEISKTLVSDTVTKAPTPEITSVGTKSDNRTTQYYWYCWNSGAPNPHHLGYYVPSDHHCTNQELLDTGYMHYQ